MLQIRDILLPTDFSTCAERAFSYAAHLAAQYGAKLHVLNVRAPHEEDPNNPMDHLKLEQEDTVTWSDANVRDEAAEALPIVHAQIRTSSPAVGILEYADRHEIDLIVMGTHGRRGLDRLLIGSTAEEVIRLATCPVFTVREDAVLPHERVARVLVPVDFSNASGPALTYAKELAAAYGAELDVLHVIEEVFLPSPYGIEAPPVTTPQTVLRIQNALQEAVDAAPGADVPAAVHVRTGHPAQGILDFASEQAVDLIVVATHGWTGMRRLLLGSVTEKIVQMAPCPVFTVKSFGRSLLVPEMEPTREAAVSGAASDS